MDLFDVLTMIGGLSLFLFGMNTMGSYLEKAAGKSLKMLLSKLTTRKILGFLTGLGVTAIIQSSSATTVMVVGFVNSGLLSLKQAINVIMGANVGTTVTAWILSLTGLEGTDLFVRLLKPSSFTPVLALIGIILIMAGKSERKKDIGTILLGFAVLMFGMETMSGAVAGLKEVPEFQNILVMFSNPILGVAAGAVLTGIIQSSSASVGILQALSATGQVTFGAAIPIIMGQNIGTTVTALLSSVGTNKNARRTAVVHLMFNVIGTVVWLVAFCAVNRVVQFGFVSQAIDPLGIAIVHTAFNVLCTALLFPFAGLLEKLVCKLIPDAETPDTIQILDERLIATPSVAIARCVEVAGSMAQISMDAMRTACGTLKAFDPKTAQAIREIEEEVDQYEDMLGTYLVKLSAMDLSAGDSRQTAKVLHLISDFERISDHAVNVLESAEEMANKGLSFSAAAKKELDVLLAAVMEIMELALAAFLENDVTRATAVEPLEEVVDTLKEQLRSRHILRLQRGECTIELGFVWSDLLTDLERVADHCSNIAGCVIEMSHDSMDIHGRLDSVRAGSPGFLKAYDAYAQKYAIM
ncbi:MAG: Na/Pi cotransporter family protein [Ruminiclostridium sp.]|nr:Na/Pi cotransporter family protein [Ruminiclostridium sp.]